ncbi:MAG: diguanylate cyclase, partial [Pseudomonadota bacterium]
MAAKAGRADMNSPSLDAERLELLGSLGSWHYDPLTGSVALSGGAAALFGLDKALTCTLDELLSMFVKPGREALAAVLYGTAEAAEEPLDADPSTVLLLTRDSNSQAGIIADVSEIVDLRRQLDFARKRQEHFETMSHEWLWETDADLRFTYMSPSVEKIVGVPVEFHIGKTRRELVGDKNESLEMEMHLAWLDRHEPFHDFRYWRAGPDGKEQYISVTGEPVLDADGSFVGYRGTARDLTGQQQIREALLQVNRQLNAANKAKSDAMGSLKEANSLLEERNRQMARAQEDIRHAALHDSLTGLGNRRFMDEELVKALERSLREGIELGVVHVDLDRFKQINDTLGHAAGDAVLVHVAEVLRTKSGVGDVIARVGGDEFVVVTLGKSGSQLLAMGDRIISTLARPFEFEGRQCWY